MKPDRPRVCIVTPSPIGSNPRVVKEADALCEAGYDVTVVATRTHDRVEPRDLALMRRIKWRLLRIDLRSRLQRWPGRAMQLARRKAFGMLGGGRLADRAFSNFTAPLTRTALQVPADLYIAHYPAALPAAAIAAQRHGAAFAYDAEDFHLGDWPDRPDHEPDRRLLREIEGRYLPHCAYVSAAAPLIADAYAQAYRHRSPARAAQRLSAWARLRSGPTAKGERPAQVRRSTGSRRPSGPIAGSSAPYARSAWRAPGRTSTCAARRRPVSPRTCRSLRRRPARQDRLHLLPPAAPDEMERLAAAYDLGLAAETACSRNRLICLTNKLFSFVLAGVPPLMSDTPGQRAFAAEAGLTDLVYPIDDAQQLASLIDRLLGDGEALAAARSKVWRLGRERYNWDLEKATLYDLVARAGLRGADREGAGRDGGAVGRRAARDGHRVDVPARRSTRCITRVAADDGPHGGHRLPVLPALDAGRRASCPPSCQAPARRRLEADRVVRG